MSRKSRRAKSPFNFEGFSKSVTLAANRMKGRMAEDSFEMSQRLQGHEVKKTHKGADFLVQRRDLFGRKRGKPITYEVKTGDSPLTEAQKRKKGRLKKDYKVVRY